MPHLFTVLFTFQQLVLRCLIDVRAEICKEILVDTSDSFGVWHGLAQLTQPDNLPRRIAHLLRVCSLGKEGWLDLLGKQFANVDLLEKGVSENFLGAICAQAL